MLYQITVNDYSSIVEADSAAEGLDIDAQSAGYDDHADLIYRVHDGDPEAVDITELGEPDGMGVLVFVEWDGDVTLYAKELGTPPWEQDSPWVEATYTCPTSGGYVRERGECIGGQFQDDRQVGYTLGYTGGMMECSGRGKPLAEMIRLAAQRRIARTSAW